MDRLFDCSQLPNPPAAGLRSQLEADEDGFEQEAIREKLAHLDEDPDSFAISQL